MPPTTLDATLETVSATLAQLLPVAGRLALIAIATLLLTRLARRAIPSLADKVALDVRAERLGWSRLVGRLQIEQTASQALSLLVIWGLRVGALGIALESLGFAALSSGLAHVLAFLPRVLLGALIVLGGVMAADRAEQLFIQIAARGDWAGSGALAKLLHYGIILLAISLAAEQIGLEVTLLRGLIAVAVGGAALSIFGVLGMGLEPMLGRLMARYYMRRTLELGDTITLDGCTGALVQFGATGLVLRGPAGTHLIPYDIAQRASLVIVARGAQAEP